MKILILLTTAMIITACADPQEVALDRASQERDRQRVEAYARAIAVVRAHLPGTQSFSPPDESPVVVNGLGAETVTGWVDYVKPVGGVERRRFKVNGASVSFTEWKAPK